MANDGRHSPAVEEDGARKGRSSEALGTNDRSACTDSLGIISADIAQNRFMTIGSLQSLNRPFVHPIPHHPVVGAHQGFVFEDGSNRVL